MSQGTPAFKMHMWVNLGTWCQTPGHEHWVIPLLRGAKKSQTTEAGSGAEAAPG